jgi:hypothetical protein
MPRISHVTLTLIHSEDGDLRTDPLQVMNAVARHIAHMGWQSRLDYVVAESPELSTVWWSESTGPTSRPLPAEIEGMFSARSRAGRAADQDAVHPWVEAWMKRVLARPAPEPEPSPEPVPERVRRTRAKREADRRLAGLEDVTD